MGALVRCEAHTEKCRIRQAIQQCWMLLAKEKRTPEELESQIRRIVDRALKDFREDLDAFGRKPEGC